MALSRLLIFYGELVGGNVSPFTRAIFDYFIDYIEPGSLIADIGGGDGKFANYSARKAKRVFIIDREGTSKPDADNRQYEGSLIRAIRTRRYQNIFAVRGDAISLPLGDASIGAIVTNQLLEHIHDDEKRIFFTECFRVLKPDGILAISTPNADFIERHRFWLPDLSRRIIPERWVFRLPPSLRGPWLVNTIRDWEAKAGHYGHGCRLRHIRAICKRSGFKELDHSFVHTRFTSFWLQLLMTFPLFYILAIPLVRISYYIESRRKIKDGINLMVVFQKKDNPSDNTNNTDAFL